MKTHKHLLAGACLVALAAPAGAQAAEGLWGTTFAQYVDRLTAAVDTVGGGGRLGAAEVAAVSVPGVPLSEPVLARLAVLPQGPLTIPYLA